MKCSIREDIGSMSIYKLAARFVVDMESAKTQRDRDVLIKDLNRELANRHDSADKFELIDDLKSLGMYQPPVKPNAL